MSRKARTVLKNYGRWKRLYNKTDSDVARAAGCYPQTISRVASGARDRWSGATEEAIIAGMNRLVPGKALTIGQLRDLEPYPKRKSRPRSERKRLARNRLPAAAPNQEHATDDERATSVVQNVGALT